MTPSTLQVEAIKSMAAKDVKAAEAAAEEAASAILTALQGLRRKYFDLVANQPTKLQKAASFLSLPPSPSPPPPWSPFCASLPASLLPRYPSPPPSFLPLSSRPLSSSLSIFFPARWLCPLSPLPPPVAHRCLPLPHTNRRIEYREPTCQLFAAPFGFPVVFQLDWSHPFKRRGRRGLCPVTVAPRLSIVFVHSGAELKEHGGLTGLWQLQFPRGGSSDPPQLKRRGSVQTNPLHPPAPPPRSPAA